MKRLTPLFFFLLFLQTAITYSQTQNIYVSGIGSDTSGNGGMNAPYKSLERALEAVTSPSAITYNLILKPSSNSIKVSKSGLDFLICTKSGSAQHPINIYSENGTATIESDDPSKHMIFLKDVSYINFSNIRFSKATRAIFFDNADYCKIEFCTFEGSSVSGDTGPNSVGGTGSIWIGKSGNYETSYIGNPDKRSDNNTIRNNHFYNLEIIEYDKQHLYHAIYLSNGSIGNSIYYNTTKMDLDIGSGIQMNHGYMDNNIVSKNFVYKTFGSGTDTSATMNSRHGINFQTQSSMEAQNTNNNVISGNYLYANYNRGYVFSSNCDPNNSSNNNFNGPQLLRIDSPLCSQNTISDNILTYGNDEFYEDPLWLDSEADKMSNRMVSGDFDGDSVDDVASLYDNGNNNTTLRVWLSSTNSFVLSKGDTGWWNVSGYIANKTTGRMVSGDFDGNGYDDIAAFYDYGSINGKKVTKLHIWLSSGTHITYQNSSGWWDSSITGTGYDANKITGRVVSGDFDSNGIDDIGAFYDYGNNVTRLHMWLSSGTHLTYQNSNGWWNVSGYNANKITDRVVSGDFDGNGIDDIGAFYDYGNNVTKLHMWLSSGTHLTYQNSNGWWNVSGYNANKITDRVVSGDFDGNGIDDIGAFYDFGNNRTRLHTWLSSGTHMTYQNSNGWWNTSCYDSNKIDGRVVAADFNNDGKDDVSAFYNYADVNAGLRSHVWHSTGNSFTYFNNSLGYPWKNLGSNDSSSKSQRVVLVNEKPLTITSDSPRIKAFPNSLKDDFQLSLEYKLEKADMVEIVLYDIQGRRIKDIIVDTNQSSGSHLIENISLDDLAKGIYILKFTTSKKTETLKIVKE